MAKFRENISLLERPTEYPAVPTAKKSIEPQLQKSRQEALRYEEEAKKEGSLGTIALRTLLGIPKAGYTVAKQAVTHPIRTSGAIATGLYEGAAKPVLKLATPKKFEGMYDIGMKARTPEEEAIQKGFKFSGALAPYAGVAKGLQVLGNAPKIAQYATTVSKALQNPLTRGAIADIGTGQLLTEADTLKDRAKQAGLDALLFGMSEFKGIKNALPKGAKADIPTKPKTTPKGEPLLEEAGKTLDERVFSGAPRERGFLTTVKGSEVTSPELLKNLERVDGQYIPRNTDALSKLAEKKVIENPLKAKDYVMANSDDQAVATGSQLIAYMQKKGDFDGAIEVADNLARKLTEAGRTIQAASIFNKLDPEAIVRSAILKLNKENLKRGTKNILSKEKAQELFNLANDAKNATGEEKIFKQALLIDTLEKVVPSTKTDKFLTLWKASLLTNPSSHIANITGNTSMLALENIKDFPAVAFDKLISLYTGKRSVSLPSLSAQKKGAISGGKKALEYLKTGIDTDNVVGKFDFTPVSYSDTPLGKIAQKYTDTVFRSLGAGDKVGKGILFNKSLRELAVVDGLNKGLSGTKLISYADNLVKSPTSDMLDIATKDALEGTFMAENALASFVSQGKGNLKGAGKIVAEFVMPFVKTPTNIAIKVAEYSPIGYVKALAQAFKGKSQREISQSLGRATTGTGIMWLGYTLAERGEMTGTYPTDETTRNIWEAEGKQPNSILIDGKWVNLDKISPIGNILAMGANIVSTKKDSEGLGETALKTAGETAKGLTEMTFLQGVSGALGALTEPERKAQAFASNAIGSLIPSIVGAGARTIDPIKRDTSGGLFDPMKNRIPFVKNTLPEKRNVFGEQQQFEGNQFFSPFRMTEAKDIPITKEISRLRDLGLDVTLTKEKKKQTLGGVTIELTPEELNELSQTKGTLLKSFFDKVLNDAQYQGLNPEQRAKVLKKGIDFIRDASKTTIRGEAINQQIREGIDEKIQEKTLQRQPFYE